MSTPRQSAAGPALLQVRDAGGLAGASTVVSKGLDAGDDARSGLPGWCGCSGVGAALVLQEPALLERSSQAHSGAMEHHPAVGFRNAQLFADLLGSQAFDLAKVESTGGGNRQISQATIEDLAEPVVFPDSARDSPMSMAA
jgi:hypothetical protein